MANPYSETPADDIANLLYGAAQQPVQQPAQQPLQQPPSPVGRVMAPPVNASQPQPMPQAPQPNAQNVASSVTQTMDTLRQGMPEPKAPFAGQDLVNQIVDNWMLPIAGLGLYGLSQTETGQKALKSLKDRFIVGNQSAAQQPMTQRIEPSFNADPAPPQAEPAKSVPSASISGDPEALQRGLLGKGGPVANPASQNAPVAPSLKDQILEQKLRRETLMTQRLEAEINSSKQTQLNGPATGTAAGNQSPVVTRVVNSQSAPDIASIDPLAKPAPTVADLAARVEAGKQAGLGLNKTEAPVVAGEAGASVAPSTEKTTKTRAAKRTPEQMTAAAAEKGINMYRNMFGFDSKDPTSAKSLAAIETTNRFISEGMEGKIPGSRDLSLNPVTDVGASGKKFYSGTPEGYRNAYIPWLEKNLNTLPPETQSHVLSSMTKGQTKDLTKIMKGLGIAGTALGAYETAFAAQQGKYGEAALRGADVATDFIPVVSQIKQGLTPQGAAAPGVPLERFEEAYKLGSPYAQTKEAKKSRLKEKAGAGRGIAPPSAYQR